LQLSGLPCISCVSSGDFVTIYVCYASYGYEGCSPPEAVFLTEEAAERYCARETMFYCTAEYKEFEINE
jgi:hypothetical protein